MNNPKVSVLISTYNRPNLLVEAIKSVLNQTFQDFEIIVIDDGQEKRADDVVQKIGDERIRYVAHKKSKGCSGSRNTGIRLARGVYIAFLDDDDVWVQNKLELQVAALEKTDSDVGFSFTGTKEIFDDRESRVHIPNGVGDYFELGLRKFSAMISSTLFFKKEVFEEVGGFNESFPTHTDIELMLRVTKKYEGVGIDKELVVRKIGGTGHVQMGSNIQRRIKGRIMLLEEYEKYFLERPKVYAKHLSLLAYFYIKVKEYSNARQTYRKVLSYSFSVKNLIKYSGCFFEAYPYRSYKKILRIKYTFLSKIRDVKRLFFYASSIFSKITVIISYMYLSLFSLPKPLYFPISLQRNKVRVVFPVSSFSELLTIKTIILEGEYDFELLKGPSSVNTVVDMGANIGVSIFYFLSEYPGAHIYAIEPDPVTFEKLSKVWGNNENVSLYNMAISGDNSKKDFYSVKNSSMSSSFVKRGKRNKKYSIESTTLDQFIKKNDVEKKIDIIKFDIEGAEYDVFKNFTSWNKTSHLIGEYHQDLTGESVEDFAKLFKKQADFKRRMVSSKRDIIEVFV